MFLNVNKIINNIHKALQEPGYAFKVFKRRSKAYLHYYLRDGYSFAPEVIYILVTSRCNLKCRMCCYWGVSGIKRYCSQEQLQEESMSGLRGREYKTTKVSRYLE